MCCYGSRPLVSPARVRANHLAGANVSHHFSQHSSYVSRRLGRSDGFRWLLEGVLTPQTSAAPNSSVFSGFAWKRQRPPSVAQAVQASRFFFVPLHGFLVARDGSSFSGDTPSVDAPALLWRSMFEGELGVARFVGFDDEHDDSG